MNDYDQERNETWDAMLEMGIATEDEMRLVTSINGFNVESLNSIIYVKTGYRSIEQLNKVTA